MGRFFALALNLPGESKAVKAPSRMLSDRPQNKTAMAVVAFLILTGMMYLVLVNELSTKGYDIKKLESQLLELKETNKRLELEVGATQAIETLEREAAVLNLVPSLKVNYPKDSNFSFQGIK